MLNCISGGTAIPLAFQNDKLPGALRKDGSRQTTTGNDLPKNRDRLDAYETVLQGESYSLSLQNRSENMQLARLHAQHSHEGRPFV